VGWIIVFRCLVAMTIPNRPAPRWSAEVSAMRALRRALSITACLVAIAGCGASKEKQARCRAQADELGRMLATAERHDYSVSSELRATLAMRGDLPRHPEVFDRPTIYVQQTGYRIHDDSFPDVRALVERLKDIRRHDRDPRVLVLAIDARTPWPQVVELVRVAATEGFSSPAFVFAAPVPPDPPRAPIDDEIDKTLAAGSPGGLGNILRRTLAGCSAATRVYDDMMSEYAKTTLVNESLLVNGIPPALVECGCDVDVANVRAVLWRILHSTNATREVRFDADAPKRQIALPAQATWQDAAPLFVSSLTNAELVVK